MFQGHCVLLLLIVCERAERGVLLYQQQSPAHLPDCTQQTRSRQQLIRNLTIILHLKIAHLLIQPPKQAAKCLWRSVVAFVDVASVRGV